MTTDAAPPLPGSSGTTHSGISARRLHDTIADVAETMGEWAVLELHKSNPGQPSRPDLLLARPGDGFLFVKVQGPNGKISNEQQRWLDFLEACGASVQVWRPSDTAEVIDRLTRPAGAV